MGAKRKRQRWSKDDELTNCKKPRFGEASSTQTTHPTLRLYYRQISTLREYLLSQLPKTSKKRRRSIASLGKNLKPNSNPSSIKQHGNISGEESLARHLDQTLVCSVDKCSADNCGYDAKDIEAYTQQISLTAVSSYGGRARTQSDLVDDAIRLLFYRVHQHIYRPPHMLCHGYQRARVSQQARREMCATAGIIGITSHYPNNNVSILKSAVWSDVLELLGREGEQVMLKMMVHCGIFARIEKGRGNFHHLCGEPLSDLKVLGPIEESIKIAQPRMTEEGRVAEPAVGITGGSRSLASICFVRSRMFYARAALNTKGKVLFGLRHIHALNRFSDSTNTNHTLQLLRYIFPREFGLHNVFTSNVDPKETVQPFKDYTMRDAELAQKKCSLPIARQAGSNVASPRIPRRLRGGVRRLVQKLQILHSKCSYHELLKHYCPVERSHASSVWLNNDEFLQQNDKNSALSVSGSLHASATVAAQMTTSNATQSLTDLATPQACVSALCRAIISTIVPDDFWGVAENGQENKRILMHNVDKFVKLRRFDPMSLHEVSQGIKISAMRWLVPLHLNPHAALAQSDMRKRKEILLEFLYYIFDSLLIPLIRSNFHVTESSAHRNHMFYFRHDVWRILTEPAMASIKLSLFREIKTPMAKKLLDGRPLGFSQIRLLPKTTGMRPITNLRRRMTRLQNGKVGLGRSINQVMTPVFNILDFERRRHPSITGSALFSVGDMYPVLKTFSANLGERHRSLYFAKADAKSCFDTIPQQELMDLMKRLVSEHEYRIARHSEIKASRSFYCQGRRMAVSKPAQRFKKTGKAPSDFDPFEEVVESSFARGKRNTVFVDGIVQEPQKTARLMELLDQHIRQNVIKIGKKFFRQTSGIPQGSIVSSLLCNFFYAQLEAENFSFLKAEESVFLRLIDDFLLITTNKAHAIRFLQIMHDGVEKFGVSINPAKTLANFKAVINGHHVPQQTAGDGFPYCGSFINTTTLEITKDRNRRKETVLANALTVDLSKVPGTTFYRKALSAFKIQMHQMFLDTGLNAPNTVLGTLYQNFAETAMKCYRYSKSMRGIQQPSADLMIGTIRDLIDLAFVLAKGKHKSHGGTNDDYDCAVSKCQIRWLAGRAFHHVLEQKQTKFRTVVTWLEGMLADARVGSQHQLAMLERIAQDGDMVFRGYRY